MEKSRFRYEDLQGIKGVFERTTDDYIFIYDLDHDHYMISARASGYFQLSEYDFDDAAEHLKEVIHPDDYRMVVDDLNEIIDKKKNKHALEYRWKTRSGRYVWISCRGEAVTGEYGYYMVGTVTEIGKHSRYDNITGLYCENVMESEYQMEHHEKGDVGCMMLIGIDNFRGINEKHGPDIGNNVLEGVAHIILACVGNSKMVYRMRGDEFAVVIPGEQKDAETLMKDLYKKIRQEVDRFIEEHGYELFFTISAGGVCFDTKQHRYKETTKNLRFALHCAKMGGKNKFAMFNQQEYEQHVRRLDIQENLRISIDNGFDGFELYYQPIYRTNGTGVLGAEALIRWNSKKYGFMSPADFIPQLEESALIIPLGRWIIEEAAEQCERFCQIIPDFVMHINLSFVQVIKSNVLKDILGGIRNCKLDHRHFVFEVTESGEIESSNAVHSVLKEIHDESFGLAIDDFGTGYSNLRYIKDLMFGIIKIDRAFITDIQHKKNNYTLVKSVIEMFHGLNLKVCVEGVETQEEFDTIMRLHPDAIQGFYFGRPVPKSEFYSQHLLKCKKYSEE